MKKSFITVGILAIAAVCLATNYFLFSGAPNVKVATRENPTIDNNILGAAESKSPSFVNESGGLNSENHTSGLNLRILDVETGMAVIPSSVEFVQRENKEVRHRFSKGDISENGTIDIPLFNGTYDISVYADGYQTMTSFFTFEDNQLNVNFNLEPLSPSKFLSSDYIQSYHTRNAIVIVGFIVDDLTGKPIDGVKVSSKDKICEAISRRDGFFQLILPLADHGSEVPLRNNLQFERSGYNTEIRENFDMWSNGDLILRIRMVRGNGANKEKVLRNREASVNLSNETY